MQIKELKFYTKKGKLHKKLFECLQRPPDNEKKLQASLDKPSDCSCPCTCNVTTSKKRKLSVLHNTSSSETLPKAQIENEVHTKNYESFDSEKGFDMQYKIPAVLNSKSLPLEKASMNIKPVNSTQTSMMKQSDKLTPNTQMSIESQDSEDQVMMQLEQLFRADPNELEDDLFEGNLYDTIESATWDVQDHTKILQDGAVDNRSGPKTDMTAGEHAAKIKSFFFAIQSLSDANTFRVKKSQQAILNGIDFILKYLEIILFWKFHQF